MENRDPIQLYREELEDAGELTPEQFAEPGGRGR